MNSLTLTQKIFILALVTQVLIGLGFGGVFLINPEYGFESFNANIYNPSLGSSAVVIAGLLIFSGLIAVLSIIWSLSKNIAGSMTGITIGIELLIIAILSFVMYDNTTLLMIDGIRGIVIFTTGILTYRQLNK